MAWWSLLTWLVLVSAPPKRAQTKAPTSHSKDVKFAAGRAPTSRSFQWPRTQDQDLHQSARALLPVGAGRDIGNTDKGAKKIDRVKVLAYVAALGRALHECANGLMDRGVGRLEHLLGVADERIQHRGDDLLRFDGVNKQQQPGSQGLHRGQGVRERSLRCGQLFHLGP